MGDCPGLLAALSRRARLRTENGPCACSRPRAISPSLRRDQRPPGHRVERRWRLDSPRTARGAACSRRTGASSSGSTSRRISTSFTSASDTLRAADEPADLRTISDYANQYSPSEADSHWDLRGRRALGAGGGGFDATQRSIAGVIGIGLPDRNELGWRWKDSLIYLTHGVPERTDVQRGVAGRQGVAVAAGAGALDARRVRAAGRCAAHDRARRRAEATVGGPCLRSSIQRQPLRVRSQPARGARLGHAARATVGVMNGQHAACALVSHRVGALPRRARRAVASARPR